MKSTRYLPWMLAVLVLSLGVQWLGTTDAFRSEKFKLPKGVWRVLEAAPQLHVLDLRGRPLGEAAHRPFKGSLP